MNCPACGKDQPLVADKHQIKYCVNCPYDYECSHTKHYYWFQTENYLLEVYTTGNVSRTEIMKVKPHQCCDGIFRLREACNQEENVCHPDFSIWRRDQPPLHFDLYCYDKLCGWELDFALPPCSEQRVKNLLVFL